jgi:hypothetical protein
VDRSENFSPKMESDYSSSDLTLSLFKTRIRHFALLIKVLSSRLVLVSKFCFKVWLSFRIIFSFFLLSNSSISMNSNDTCSICCLQILRSLLFTGSFSFGFVFIGRGDLRDCGARIGAALRIGVWGEGSAS